jgi:hypothetical protein
MATDNIVTDDRAGGRRALVEVQTTAGGVAFAEMTATQMASGDAARIGAANETAPASDTASSGLNGRLQRIAQRLTTIIAGIPLLAGETHVGQVGGESAIIGGTITRPADTVAYVAGDLVANSTTAGSVVPLACAAARINAGTGVVRRARLSTTKTGLAGTEVFRIHLFKTAPTVANGDNGAFSCNGVAAILLGYIDVTMDRIFTDGAKGIGVPAVGSEIMFQAGAGTTNIYALVEARGAYTPISGEVLTVALEVMRD